jgi:hypothetical protein
VARWVEGINDYGLMCRRESPVGVTHLRSKNRVVAKYSRVAWSKRQRTPVFLAGVSEIELFPENTRKCKVTLGQGRCQRDSPKRVGLGKAQELCSTRSLYERGSLDSHAVGDVFSGVY